MAMGYAEITAAVQKFPRKERVAFGRALVLSLETENLDSEVRTRVDELRKEFDILKARFEARTRVPRIFWKTVGTLRRIGPGSPKPISMNEIQKRIEDFDAGRAETIPADEVFRAAREGLRKILDRRGRQ